MKAIHDPSKVDAFALEFHPNAYPLADLVRTISAWGTHQVSFSASSSMLYAVANECLYHHATHAY